MDLFAHHLSICGRRRGLDWLASTAQCSRWVGPCSSSATAPQNSWPEDKKFKRYLTWASHLSSVVKDWEVSSCLEVALDKLGMLSMAGDHLLHEGLVGGLWEPALLVHQGHDAHWLGGQSWDRIVIAGLQSSKAFKTVFTQPNYEHVMFSRLH